MSKKLFFEVLGIVCFVESCLRRARILEMVKVFCHFSSKRYENTSSAVPRVYHANPCCDNLYRQEPTVPVISVETSLCRFPFVWE